MFFPFNNFHRGWLMWAMWKENLFKWLIILISLHNSLLFAGDFIFWIACILFGSEEISLAPITWPRNAILVQVNRHFSLLSVTYLASSFLALHVYDYYVLLCLFPILRCHVYMTHHPWEILKDFVHVPLKMFKSVDDPKRECVEAKSSIRSYKCSKKPGIFWQRNLPESNVCI